MKELHYCYKSEKYCLINTELNWWHNRLILLHLSGTYLTIKLNLYHQTIMYRGKKWIYWFFNIPLLVTIISKYKINYHDNDTAIYQSRSRMVNLFADLCQTYSEINSGTIHRHCTCTTVCTSCNIHHCIFVTQLIQLVLQAGFFKFNCIFYNIIY
jgi:hypothetical protein